MPVDGIVVARNVEVGQTVAASFATPNLFLIALDLTKMQVDTNVSESDIGGITEGKEATFTVERFHSMLAARRTRLKSLLLDQRFLAGLGNIYVDEALWRARLHPLAVASTLRGPEVERLHRAIVGVLSEAVEARGSSIDDYTGPDGDGRMQERLAVYQRGGAPCPRCARPIRRAALGGRGTHFCPYCQPLPRGRRAVAASALRRTKPARRTGPRWSDALQTSTVGATAAERAAARRRAARNGGLG